MQIFYSTGVAYGGMITLASYNKFNNNCYVDGCLIPILNSCSSIFAGFVIFSVIGFMAHTTQKDVADVVSQGPGLVFVVYPSAIASMPLPVVWSVIFFLTLFMVGLDTQFGMVETVMSGIIDWFPNIFNTSYRKTLIRGVVCITLFLLGIPCVTNGGMYVLQVMDWYSCVFSIMILCFSECLVIGWVYGVERFYRDIALMIGYRPFLVWKLLWCFVTPSLALGLFILSAVMLEPVSYGDYIYPGWVIGIGWILSLASLIPLPIVCAVKVYQADGTILDRFKHQLKPTPAYGPAADKSHVAHVYCPREIKVSNVNGKKIKVNLDETQMDQLLF